MIPYNEFPGFEHIYPEDSFVLSCDETDAEIVFSIDLVLTSTHPSYTPAKPGERYCYRFGKLSFGKPSSVIWTRKEFQPGIDANGEIDFGNIDWMMREGDVYHLAGLWGDVKIKSELPTIMLTTS